MLAALSRGRLCRSNCSIAFRLFVFTVLLQLPERFEQSLALQKIRRLLQLCADLLFLAVGHLFGPPLRVTTALLVIRFRPAILARAKEATNNIERRR